MPYLVEFGMWQGLKSYQLFYVRQEGIIIIALKGHRVPKINYKAYVYASV